MRRMITPLNTRVLALEQYLEVVVSWTTVLTILFLPLGCSSGASSVSPETDDTRSSLFELGLTEGGKRDSVQGAISFACIELGVDPWRFQNIASGTLEELLEQLQESTESQGALANIQSVVPAELFINELEIFDKPETSKRQRRAILVDSNGLAYSLIGTAFVNDRLMVQLMRGSSVLPLVSQDDLIRADFSSAWIFDNPGNGVALRVGKTNFRIDKLFKNFGKIENAQSLMCRFVIKNTGEQTLSLGTPRVSCSCVTTDYDADLEVQPGEKWRIKAEIQSSNSELMQHEIVIPITEISSGSTRDITFSLIGFTPQSMGVTPRMLDFGTLAPGELSERQVRVTESTTDRIDSIDVQVEDLPVSFKINEVGNSGGLRNYRLVVTCNGSDLESGKNEGSIIIDALQSNGQASQSLVIPTKAHLSPLFWLEPSSLDLGVTSPGSVVSGNISIECLEDEDSTIEEIRVLDAPAECEVEISEASKGTSRKVAVRFTPTATGVWSGRVTMLVIAGDSVARQLHLTCISEVK